MGSGGSKQESGNTNNTGNHGVINYNFYNQQWQNSVDLEGALQQNETSYGGTGGGGSQHNKDSNLLTTGIQAAAGILPLLADSVTEDFENSDRISKTQAGATTLISQHQVGRMLYAGKHPNISPSSAADQPTTAGPSIDRFITLPLGEWTTSIGVYGGWAAPLPWVPLTQQTPFAALARRHFLLNCGWHVQVQVNSTRFHGGALGVFMVPQFVYTNQSSLHLTPITPEDHPLFSNQQLFLYPHQILNPRTNSSAEVIVPYANNTPSCDPTQQAPWTLLVVVLSPLSYSAGATTSLTVYASFRPIDAEFHGIRQSNSDFQGLPKVRNESASYTFCSTQPNSTEPDYGAITRSSPRFLPAQVTDLLQISSIPTLVSERAVLFTQTAADKPLMTMNVSLTATDLLNTSLESVSRGFAQYRGSICMKMIFTGNQMQNTRYVAAYTPPGADPPVNRQQAMEGLYTIFDTGLNSASKFVIPFISTTDYRYCNAVSGIEVGSAGYFTIWQLTNLAVPPGSPATAELLVFASSGEDFEWRAVSSPYLAFQGEDTQVAPGETGQLVEATAANSNAEVVPIPYSQARLSNSSLRFWFDRYFLLDAIPIHQKTNATDLFLLKWPDILWRLPEVLGMFHCTYVRFELELALRPWNKDDLDMEMIYWPPGSYIPTGNSTWHTTTTGRRLRHTGPLPRWVWNTTTTPTFTARIPFCCAASVLTQTYTGWSNTSHASGTFGTAPGLNTLGALTIASSQFSTTTTTTTEFYVFARFADVQGWCPRPGQYLTPPTPAHRGATNYSLLQLAGDVETNPGPSLSKIARRLDPDIDQLFKKFESMQESFKKVVDYANWAKIFEDADKEKWMKRIGKFLCYAVILSRAKGDPLLSAALGYLLAQNWLHSLCGKFVKHLRQYARTSPPPFPDLDEDPDEGTSSATGKDQARAEQILAAAQEEYARRHPNPFDEVDMSPLEKFKNFFKIPKMQGSTLTNLNQLLVLCRNAQWLGGQLQKLLDWLGLWKKQEEEVSEEHFKELMKQYPAKLTEFETYRNAPKHPKWKECKEWFDKMRQLVVLHDPKLTHLFPLMVEPAPEKARTEPILLVLRGKPGQGKSVAAAALAQMCAYTLSGKPDYYSYNASTNYFDGYNQQPVVLIDDLGQDPAGTDFSVFCQMISTTPFIPNMASLNDKGIKFTSDVIIVTTNLSEFRPVTISDPGALQRRINFDYVVTAGTSFLTKKGTLDLDKALQPTGAACPFPFCKSDVNMFSSACLKFRDVDAKCECSLVDVYSRVVNMHKTKTDILGKFVGIFKFEGPGHDPRMIKPLPKPRGAEVRKWCDLAVNTTLHDDEVLSFLRKHFDSDILNSYVARFYGGGPDPLKTGPSFMDVIGVLTQCLALFIMVLSLGVVVWQLCHMEGAYGGPVKRDRKVNALKLVDIAGLQGPLNLDMEKTLLERSCAVMQMDGPTGKQATGVLFIKGRVCAINYHLWERATHFQLETSWIPKEDIPAVRPVIDGVPSELVFMNWARFPGRSYRDITQFFPSNSELKIPPSARAVGLGPHLGKGFMFQAEPLSLDRSIRTWECVVPNALRYRASTAPGFCGSTIVLDAGPWKKVFGIHCAGSHGIGIAAVITQEMLATVFSISSLQGKIVNVKPHPYVHTPHKTAFYPTPACDDQTTVAPAPLSAADTRLTDPLNFKKSVMKKHVGDTTTGPVGMISAARSYARWVRYKCGPVSERLSLQEAVQGFVGLDPMDMQRSPGWPYMGQARRADLISFKPDGAVVMDEVLQAELQLFALGDFSQHKFVTFLKDETRPLEKVAAGATRVIDIASFGHAIFGRVLFGRLAAAMHASNGVPLGSAVGTNPDQDWLRYANEFRFKNFADVDYSGFDATHTSYTFYCLKVFLSELGFDEIALKYIDSLCVSQHLWDDEEYTLVGGLPSGCSCTSILNTVMNNIVMRSFIPECTDCAFDLLAYGDDLIICSEEKFDLNLLKKLIEEYTMYKVTPAGKSGEFKWTGLDQVVFLKRSFVTDGLLVRPTMTEANLHNILSYARAGTITEKLSSVARLAQHNGKAVYDRLFEPFEKTGFYIPSFDDLELEFFSLFFG